jgi:hypothetical protein
MPPSLFLQAKVQADSTARAHKSHKIWGPTLFRALRSVLKGKSRHEIAVTLEDARGAIEQRSLYIREDRMLLLNDLNAMRKELLPNVVQDIGQKT